MPTSVWVVLLLCCCLPHPCLLLACPSCQVVVWIQTPEWAAAPSNSCSQGMQGCTLAEGSVFHFREQWPCLPETCGSHFFLPPSSDQLLYCASPAPTSPQGDWGQMQERDQEAASPGAVAVMRVCLKCSSNWAPQLARQTRAWRALKGPRGRELGSHPGKLRGRVGLLFSLCFLSQGLL